jgi:hypothetical protein
MGLSLLLMNIGPLFYLALNIFIDVSPELRSKPSSRLYEVSRNHTCTSTRMLEKK